MIYISVTTYSNARKNFKAMIEQVNEDSDAITITTKDNNAVLISEAEYNKFVETIYLLQSPAHARHLAKSIEQLKKVRGKKSSWMSKLNILFTHEGFEDYKY